MALIRLPGFTVCSDRPHEKGVMKTIKVMSLLLSLWLICYAIGCFTGRLMIKVLAS